MNRSEFHFLKSTLAVVIPSLMAVSAPLANAQREIATGIEEVVVTAQKREENLQEVPLAVTALDAAALDRTFARDLLDITGKAPNLIVDPVLGNGTAAISIRGMQLNDVEKSFDPAVAVYLDGVYLATTTGALLQVWDAEAVEVLRGPQGTLFGRNTIGGLVHIRRAKPTGELGGRVTGTFGSYRRTDVNASLNLPAMFNDTLSLKGTVMYRDGGGYFENTTRDAREGDTDFHGFTLSALWEPSEDFSAWLTYDYLRDDTPTRPVTSLTQAGEVFNAFCGLDPALCGNLPQDADANRRPTTTLEQRAYIHTDALTLNATWDLNEDHSLHAVVGWRDSDEDAIQEFDGLGSDAGFFPFDGDFFWTQRPQELEQTSVELRWQGDWSDSRVRTVAGVYYMESEYSLDQKTNSSAFFGVPGAPDTVVISSQPQFEQEMESYAVFGQIDWDLTDRITVSAGARYINEEKWACGNQRLELTGVGVITTTSYGSTTSALCNPSDPFYSNIGTDPVTGQSYAVTGEESWSEVTPRLAVTYGLDNGIVFASYTAGFRSGGFNGRATTATTLGPYEPEEVDSIELGAKTQWMNDRLQLNATVFFTDYKQKQEDVVFPDPVAVTQTLVQNAADATLNGLELELVAVPIDGLTLSATYGYLDASYDDWTVPDPFLSTPDNIVPIDQSGFELRRAPEQTLYLDALYEMKVGAGSVLVFNANYLWRDDYWVSARTNNTQPGRPGLNEAFGILDASISWETENFRASIFGKNLTEEDYWLHVLDVGANVVASGPTNPTPVYVPGLWTFGTINNDAIFGVELDYRF